MSYLRQFTKDKKSTGRNGERWSGEWSSISNTTQIRMGVVEHSSGRFGENMESGEIMKKGLEICIIADLEESVYNLLENKEGTDEGLLHILTATQSARQLCDICVVTVGGTPLPEPESSWP